MAHNFGKAVQQCTKELAADLRTEGGLFLSKPPVNRQHFKMLDKNFRDEVNAAQKHDI